MRGITCGDLSENRFINCDYVNLDILNEHNVLNVLQDYNTIINCTGQITNPFSTCFLLNSIGASNIIKAITNTRARLVQISTVTVYGSTELCSEDSAINPETNYATAKAYAEQILYRGINSKRLTILRLCNLYGGRQAKGIYAYLLKSYSTDRKLKFNNNGDLVRSFMHVEDCANIISDIAKDISFSGIYNIGGNETYTVKELVRGCEKRLQIQFLADFNQSPPWENIESIDDSKLKGDLGTKAKWNIFECIEKEIG